MSGLIDRVLSKFIGGGNLFIDISITGNNIVVIDKGSVTISTPYKPRSYNVYSFAEGCADEYYNILSESKNATNISDLLCCCRSFCIPIKICCHSYLDGLGVSQSIGD